jgi:hypothetical protein
VAARGIDLFREHVTERIDTKAVMLRKVIGDASRIIRMVGDAADVWEGASVEFEKSWSQVRSEVLAGVGGDSTQADREDALCRLEDLTARIAVKSGPVVGEEVRSLADRALIESLVVEVAASGPAEPTQNPSMWGRLTGSEPNAQPSERGELLDKRLGEPLRSILWRRALLAATVAHTGVGAVQLEDRIGKTTD